MSTNIVKWDDAANRFTAYCDDDTGKTEIGPDKWDDANDKRELNCNSTDFQVKWNDTENRWEARNVDAACCAVFDNCCDEASIDVTVDSSVNDCGLHPADCTSIRGNTYTCTYASKEAEYCRWNYFVAGTINVQVYWYFTGANEGDILVTVDLYFLSWAQCFHGQKSIGTNCDDLPTTINNDYGAGDCRSSPTYWEGYDGSVAVDWT